MIILLALGEARMRVLFYLQIIERMQHKTKKMITPPSPGGIGDNCGALKSNNTQSSGPNLYQASLEEIVLYHAGD